jgi:DNA-3-methyladenine glycosylase I
MRAPEEMEPLKRCEWCTGDPIYLRYHDEEWGVPVYEDSRLFEMLVLEGAQAGLSWLTILRKREAYRRAFHGFDLRQVALFDEGKVEHLLREPGIVRNRLKIQAAVQNARAALEIREREGSLSAFLWGFVGGRPIQNNWASWAQIPDRTPHSMAMARELKAVGFRFVGPTICYSFMQAVGMVNDHELSCFRYAQIRDLAERHQEALI